MVILLARSNTKGFVILEDAAVRRVRFAGEHLSLPRLTGAKVGIRHRDHRPQELLRPDD